MLKYHISLITFAIALNRIHFYNQTKQLLCALCEIYSKKLERMIMLIYIFSHGRTGQKKVITYCQSEIHWSVCRDDESFKNKSAMPFTFIWSGRRSLEWWPENTTFHHDYTEILTNFVVTCFFLHGYCLSCWKFWIFFKMLDSFFFSS